MPGDINGLPEQAKWGQPDRGKTPSVAIMPFSLLLLPLAWLVVDLFSRSNLVLNPPALLPGQS